MCPQPTINGLKVAMPSSLPLLSILWLVVGLVAEAFVYCPTTPRNYFLSTRQFQYNSASAATSIDLTATECPTTTTCEDITVALPESGESNNNWPTNAAKILSKYGVCALIIPSPSPSPTSQITTNSDFLIPQSSCDAVNTVVSEHLAKLHRKIEKRGIDSTGVEDGPYRFREVVCRDGSPRFDVPIPVRCDDDSGDSLNEKLGDYIDDTHACETIENFHREVNVIVQPVVDALWGSETKQNIESGDQSSSGGGGRATSAGFLVNKPGSTSQQWHRDGPTDGYINAFVPLVDLNESLGPTAILPRTHMMPNLRMNNNENATDRSNKNDTLLLPNNITPMLKKGQVLLFDYRTLHKGLGNTNNVEGGKSRTLAYVVYRGSITDVHNFPDALTLEYD